MTATLLVTVAIIVLVGGSIWAANRWGELRPSAIVRDEERRLAATRRGLRWMRLAALAVLLTGCAAASFNCPPLVGYDTDSINLFYFFE